MITAGFASCLALAIVTVYLFTLALGKDTDQ